jgi:hypothetical protein
MSVFVSKHQTNASTDPLLTDLREPEGAPVEAKEVVLGAHPLRIVARRHGHGRRRGHALLRGGCCGYGSGLGVGLLLGLGCEEERVDVLCVCVLI